MASLFVYIYNVYFAYLQNEFKRVILGFKINCSYMYMLFLCPLKVFCEFFSILVNDHKEFDFEL